MARTVKAAVKELGRAAIRASTRTPLDSSANRAKMIESAQSAAAHDTRFKSFAISGDRLRDQRDWAAAEAAYASALSLHPYERSYWVQHGHMAKEQEQFAKAEISYRTASAFGASVHDVLEHLRFVMNRQHADEGRFPIRFYQPGPTAQRVPGKPDVMLLARLAWQVGGMDDHDMLTLLRGSSNCDELFARMIADPQFERANRIWLELVREDEL
jgi:tetratricopeptide (TPR) repeat protein